MWRLYTYANPGQHQTCIFVRASACALALCAVPHSCLPLCSLSLVAAGRRVRNTFLKSLQNLTPNPVPLSSLCVCLCFCVSSLSLFSISIFLMFLCFSLFFLFFFLYFSSYLSLSCFFLSFSLLIYVLFDVGVDPDNGRRTAETPPQGLRRGHLRRGGLLPPNAPSVSRGGEGDVPPSHARQSGHGLDAGARIQFLVGEGNVARRCR